MFASRNKSLRGATCLVSGSGNVAQHTVEKLLDIGATVVTLSDSSGYIFDETGVSREKLAYMKTLKNERRQRIEGYIDKYDSAVYTPVDPEADHNPLWNHKADCAFPCATQNEINENDAQNLVNNHVSLVCEGANMPTTAAGISVFLENNVLYGPGKAANAGGVSVSGL